MNKYTLITCSLISAALLSTSQAAEVTNWSVIAGTAGITNPLTDSPTFDSPDIGTMGSFGAISLADGEGISFTGSLQIGSGDFENLQVRVGIFEENTGDYEGVYNSVAGYHSAGRTRYSNGLANPYGSTGAIDLGDLNGGITPSGDAPSGIPLDFVFTMTRNGSNWDIFGSFDNSAGGGSYSTSGTLSNVTIAGLDASTAVFDSAGALFGGALSGTSFQIINADVSVIPEPSMYALFLGLMGFGAVIVRRR